MTTKTETPKRPRGRPPMGTAPLTSGEIDKRYRATLRARGITEFRVKAHQDDHAALQALADQLAASRRDRKT